jgi:hypothetical protein
MVIPPTQIADMHSHLRHHAASTLTRGSVYAGRDMVHVSLPGTSLIDYCLPSLLPSEVDFIRVVEERLRTATYASNRVVPIFWDTETTGLSSIEWWSRQTQRIVQLAALTDARHGGFQFKQNWNPYPISMSEKATATTKLSTQHVWSSDLCPQVRSRDCIIWRLPVPEMKLSYATATCRPLCIFELHVAESSSLHALMALV